ncbi:hypothetical protein Xen7305DRAFT_00002810 [Xenococcus sp. PCC 7305]|uniref:hypothetical protein n=1 Tax=Xenococcus sp. PCC 7305 TaxID=102125 RepID=UPI0002ABF207|nr:hypothetical protein [Xenococcus sp. PCC 7305]ELS00580.1 hypothetical protein Xen7305DRAFT_00002810 [Xenococcus sp. PCC 7305]
MIYPHFSFPVEILHLLFIMNLQLQEISITFIVENFNPNILNFDILFLTEVIPHDWQLATTPIHDDQEIIICFDNQVSMIVQENQISLAEFLLPSKSCRQLNLGKIAKNLITKFPEIMISGISITPNFYHSTNQNTTYHKSYWENKLFSQSWHKFNGHKMLSAGFKIAYPYKTGQLILQVSQGFIQVEEQILSAFFFTGNFDYRIFSTNLDSRAYHIQQILENLQPDIDKFQEFIRKKFSKSLTNNLAA